MIINTYYSSMGTPEWRGKQHGYRIVLYMHKLVLFPCFFQPGSLILSYRWMLNCVLTPKTCMASSVCVNVNWAYILCLAVSTFLVLGGLLWFDESELSDSLSELLDDLKTVKEVISLFCYMMMLFSTKT